MKWEKHDRRNNISKRERIEIQSEAFYRALKRIESEKKLAEIPTVYDFTKKEKMFALFKAFFQYARFISIMNVPISLV